MENEPKTEVLLRMMEQPERYTEEQWNDILSDNECRELYTLMALTRGSFDAAKADAALTDEEIEREWERVKDPPPKSLQSEHLIVSSSVLPIREGVVTFENESTLPSTHSTPSLTGRVRGGSALHRIAAIFIAAAFLGGLAWALVPRLRSHHTAEPSQPTKVSAPSLTGRAGGESGLLSFSNLRLDSILTIVAAHYECKVCFRDTTAQALRLSTVWDREDSLSVFLETLNEFDGLRLTDERDTIFVESLMVEDK